LISSCLTREDGNRLVLLTAKEEAGQQLGDDEQGELRLIRDGQTLKMRSRGEEYPEAFHCCR